jgi:UDP:flavonoid glycosyltransferase YjiC (YdhE family)
MARILFAWELGGGLGHVASMLPVARELKSRGHEVVIAVRNVLSAATVFEGTGLSFVQCPYQTWKVPVLFRRLQTYAHILHSVGFNDGAGLASLIAAWRHLFNLVDPDMVLFDHSPTALLAARSHRAKRVLLGVGFSAPPIISPLPALLADDIPNPPVMIRDEELVLGVTNEALQKASMPPLQRLCDIYRDVDQNILLTYEELDHFGPREDVRYWGVDSHVPAEPPVWPRGAGKKVFAYLKPLPGTEALLERLRETGCPTIVVGTWVDDQARSRFGSETLTLESRLVDIAAVGEQSDLAILNGTHGTTAEMLLRGTPVLQLPIFVEQALVSRKVVAMGAGLVVNLRETQPAVAALTTMLGTDQYTLAARGFADKYANSDPAASFEEMMEVVARLLP